MTRRRATALYPTWAGLWQDPRNLALLSGETSDGADLRGTEARSIARGRTGVRQSPVSSGRGPSRT